MITYRNVSVLALFLLFSVIETFEWFLMGSLHKNIHLMLEFCKAPLLVQHFSKYTLMTFLMVLSIILLSMLMIILSTLKSDQPSDLRHCIQENWSPDSFYEVSFSWGFLLSFSLPYDHAWNNVVISWLVLLNATGNC